MDINAVTRQKAQADALFLSIGEGAIATDEKGNISRINRAALEILSIREEDVIGKWFPGSIVAVDSSGILINPLERTITRAVLSGKAISERSYYKKINGDIVPVFVTVSPIILDDKPIGAIEVFRDISNEVEVDQLKSDFISIASHQLRTPATAVKNLIGLLKEGYVGSLTDEQLFIIDQAYASNEAQLEIVNNLLYAARAESSSVKLKYEDYNLVEMVKVVMEDLGDVIKERSQQVALVMPDEVTMDMDTHFMRMLVENLISNASKYTPDGGSITVEVKEHGNKIQLAVSDNGVGIAKSDLPKLFNRFSRIDNELSTIRGGSGIGLYLVKRVAMLHHGFIDVSSAVGEGTKFIVKLPKEKNE